MSNKKYLNYKSCVQLTKDGFIPEEGNRYIICGEGDTPIKSDYLFNDGEVWAATQDDWDDFYKVEPIDTKDIVVDDEPIEPKPEDIGEPEDLPINKLMNELNTYKNKYLLAVADLDNVRKRTATEKLNIQKYQNEKIGKDLIAVVDNFERSLNANEDEGVKLIYNQLVGVLTKYEITEININAHDMFDDSIMNATGTLNLPNFEKDEVIAVQQKGYMIKDKVLRYANVITRA